MITVSYICHLYAPRVSVHGPHVELAIVLNRFRMCKRVSRFKIPSSRRRLQVISHKRQTGVSKGNHQYHTPGPPPPKSPLHPASACPSPLLLRMHSWHATPKIIVMKIPVPVPKGSSCHWSFFAEHHLIPRPAEVRAAAPPLPPLGGAWYMSMLGVFGDNHLWLRTHH